MAFDPNQPMLLPVNLREALPDSHPALLIGELVERLDLSEVYGALPEEEAGGRPGFDPRMMVRVWLYAYAAGTRSSRKLAQALIESVPYRGKSEQSAAALLGVESLPHAA